MEDYSQTIKLLTEHVTVNKRLRASMLLKFLQEASIAHTELLGMTKDKTLDKGLLWVIGRQIIDIKRMPVYDETIKVATYPGCTMHSIFPRNYIVTDAKGNQIITGTAMWALIDIKTRRKISPEEHGVVLPDLSNGRNQVLPLAIQIPSSLSLHTLMKAKFSQCDLNGHINNTSYLDIAEDLIPTSFLKENELTQIAIEYNREVPLDQELALDYGKEGSAYYFSSSAFKIKLSF